MRDLRVLVRFAIVHPTLGPPAEDGSGGAFMVPCPKTGTTLGVIASTGVGWDHVSVSLQHRIPNWTEMEFVKRLFFRDDETAMQLHVPAAEYINVHTHCLHLWRPNDGRTIPRPPSHLVA